jgi:hypothetical protein
LDRLFNVYLLNLCSHILFWIIASEFFCQLGFTEFSRQGSQQEYNLQENKTNKVLYSNSFVLCNAITYLVYTRPTTSLPKRKEKIILLLIPVLPETHDSTMHKDKPNRLAVYSHQRQISWASQWLSSAWARCWKIIQPKPLHVPELPKATYQPRSGPNRMNRPMSCSGQHGFGKLFACTKHRRN